MHTSYVTQKKGDPFLPPSLWAAQGYPQDADWLASLGAPHRPPRCGAPLQPFLGHARQAGRAISRLARPLLVPTPTCLIQTTGSQEPASGNSPAARRLWRWQTSRGGRTAPLLRRSSGAVRLFLRQTNLGLYGAAHGIRRAVPAQGARARPFSRGDPGSQGPSAVGAHHAPAAERCLRLSERVPDRTA